MATVSRDILRPYLDAYRNYLNRQERGENVRPLSNVQEDYKRGIAVKAAETLDQENWTETEIGEGAIGDYAIKAVQRNLNLIGRFQVSGFADKVREDFSVSERLLYDLYHDRKDQKCFDRSCELFGRKYDLIAYLYFITDPSMYLPLRSSIFDGIFKKLEIDLQTTGRYSWDNYQEFLATVAEVRDVMKDYYKTDDVDLLDAHSFLWTINLDDFDSARDPSDAMKAAAEEAEYGYDDGVYHKDYGEGSIVKLTIEKIYVDFNGKQRIFPYPEAFEREYLKRLYQVHMEKRLSSMSQENYTRRAQIPIRRSRYDYLLSQYVPERNDQWIMLQRPGHFLIYDAESKYCLFDGAYLVFEKAADRSSEEDPIAAVITEITINQDPVQFPDKIENDLRLFADLILEGL